MKKTLSFCLVLIIVLSLSVCIQAAGAKVVLTGNSGFQVGDTATVDITATAQGVLSDGSITSELYEAALERFMLCTWQATDASITKQGSSVVWSDEDAGHEFICRVGFYSDSACTEFVDYIDSDPFTVTGAPAVEATIMPRGDFYLVVGQKFSVQLNCNVSGVTFDRFRSSLPDGLTLTSDGLLSGTPTTATGEFPVHTVIGVWKGDEMIADEGFTFYISQKVIEPPEITTSRLPEATAGKSYSVKLKCSDPDATFTESYNPGKSNDLSKTGLTLTQHGELEGKPAKAGSYTFTICASGEGGEGYATFTLTVKEPVQETTEATEAETTAATETDTTIASETAETTLPLLIAPAPSAEATDAPTETTGVPQTLNPSGSSPLTQYLWLIIVIAAVVVSALVVVIVILVVKGSKKAKS